jgi:hypothetical protein
MSTFPPLGWAGTVGMVVVIVGLVVGIVVYHVWLDRRLKAERDRAAGTPTPRR